MAWRARRCSGAGLDVQMYRICHHCSRRVTEKQAEFASVHAVQTQAGNNNALVGVRRFRTRRLSIERGCSIWLHELASRECSRHRVNDVGRRVFVRMSSTESSKEVSDVRRSDAVALQPSFCERNCDEFGFIGKGKELR